MFRCPEISPDNKFSPSNTMCRINEIMQGWDCNDESWGCRKKIANTIKDILYVDFPEVKSMDECTLQCTQKADSVGQKGCCEYRVAEEGSCKWTGANGHAYLAHEYRYEGVHNETKAMMTSTKNTKAVLCTSGKRGSNNQYHSVHLAAFCYLYMILYNYNS